MESIGLDEVGNALLITLGLLVVSISVVTLAMWGVYRFFKTKNDENDSNEPKSE